MEVENWSVIEDKLVREFSFSDFVSAVAFLDSIVPIAKEAEHHPDVLIHSYKKVRVSLVTHDAGNLVTEKDYELAGKINGLVD